MIAYRSFRNGDPPHLLRLWHECGLGRGAARGFTCDALDLLVFSPFYFDPAGLICALDGKRVVGFVHAGFACDSTGHHIDPKTGVICVIMVHPEYRRQGIGRELMRQAENYVRAKGTTEVQAGSAEPCDPFYLALYGGAEPAGFLDSDPLARPFLTALGYQAGAQRLVFQRDLSDDSESVDFRVITVRRRLQIGITDQPPTLHPWWVNRYGRLDSVRFLEVPRQGGAAVAEVTCFGLDLYADLWQERPAALTRLFVPPTLRRKTYGKTMLLDVFRRLRDETVTCVEMHVGAENITGVQLLKSAGCQQVDSGTVYSKIIAE